MNIRLLTLSALAAVGVIAAAGSADLAGAAQMKQPVKKLTYGLGTNQAISCKAGRTMILRHGFRHVRTVECFGSHFTYMGQRHSHNYKIKLNAHTGQITQTKRV